MDKTKIVVFRNGGVLGINEKWTYGGEEIEIVNSFNYLGMVLSSGGKYIKATNTLSRKALRAMNALFSITKVMQVPIKIMFNLFDAFVQPILNYGCEIWGFASAENIERVHRKFCKWLINVKMSTNTLSLAGEFLAFPTVYRKTNKNSKILAKFTQHKERKLHLTDNQPRFTRRNCKKS